MVQANEILSNLWLGDIRDSKNIEFIDSMDIIINCTKNLPFINKKKKCFRIHVEDNLEKIEIINLYKYLESITKIINQYLKLNQKIFVHCYAGKQRSATVICAYLIKFLKIPYKEAKQLISSKRKHVFTPLTNFEGALELFERENLTIDTYKK